MVTPSSDSCTLLAESQLLLAKSDADMDEIMEAAKVDLLASPGLIKLTLLQFDVRAPTQDA